MLDHTRNHFPAVDADPEITVQGFESLKVFYELIEVVGMYLHDLINLILLSPEMLAARRNENFMLGAKVRSSPIVC